MPNSQNNNVLSISQARPTSSAASAGRIALVDDDDLFREALSLNLADEGYDVVTFDRGTKALSYFADGGAADIVLLDWRMPEIDGIKVLHRLREAGVDVPVIFLTVLSDQIYEEAALAGGAIDFVEKSRSLAILLRRMQLIVEGRKALSAATPGPEQSVRIGSLELHLDGCRAFWRGQGVDLTLTEFKIAMALATKAGRDVSYREIYDLARGTGFIAGYGDVGYRSNVRAFIKRIRQKFKSVDMGFDQIENYPGFGYRWLADRG
ncbi:MAG TPA: response regulator transcription factor [Alphaproteobacteria bacterium]|nr:response regulator transcription factor [Alphaproteobacteria bacterium]